MTGSDGGPRSSQELRSELLFGGYLDRGLLSSLLNKEACSPVDAGRHLLSMRGFCLRWKLHGRTQSWEISEQRNWNSDKTEPQAHIGLCNYMSQSLHLYCLSQFVSGFMVLDTDGKVIINCTEFEKFWRRGGNVTVFRELTERKLLKSPNLSRWRLPFVSLPPMGWGGLPKISRQKGHCWRGLSTTRPERS